MAEPFSLSCIYCDAGQGIETEGEAIAAGWTGIEPDDGLSWTHLGVCPSPECRELDES